MSDENLQLYEAFADQMVELLNQVDRPLTPRMEGCVTSLDAIVRSGLGIPKEDALPLLPFPNMA